MSIDINFNYLIQGRTDTFPNDFIVDKRIDPDASCKQLYDDILVAYFREDEDVENWEQIDRNQHLFYTIRLNQNILLSSDYIGPSVYWARECGISDDNIILFLKRCRTIGGHIVWQRGRNLKLKVNTSRSAVYDRFDWTLILLKMYLNSQSKEMKSLVESANLKLPEKFRNTKNVNEKFEKIFGAFQCSDWLNKFTFNDFCIHFKLCGSFVDSTFNVIPMAELFPILPRNYQLYIDNICQAVDIRNTIIKYY